MAEVTKLMVVVVLILILLRLKIDLGIVMFLSSLLLGILFNFGVEQFLQNISSAIMDPATLQLLVVVSLIYILSSILKQIKSLEGINESLQKMIGDYRLILFLISSFLGLIPMPAGAMFSAPLLKEVGEKNGMNPEEIMFANYWFRHVWEFIWPLIPGVILYASVIKVEIREIMILQFPLSMIAISIGFFWMFTTLMKKRNTRFKDSKLHTHLLLFFRSVWPILFIIFLVLILDLDFMLALSIAILLLLVFYKFSLMQVREMIFHDISLKVLFMIIGIMLFKQVLGSTDLMNVIPQFFSGIGIDFWIILFIIPFLLGFLTGITVGFIGISFPILMPYFQQGGSLNMEMVMFAYIAGFSGMMLSPMHLCFNTTMHYFKAEIMVFYKKVFFAILFFLILSILYIYCFFIIR